MESTHARLKELAAWASLPRVRAMGITVIVLAIIAVLQVKNLQPPTAMCELLSGYRLQTEDLTRLQIAFSQDGLTEFEVRDHSIFVPRDQHAAFLATANKFNAIPSELRENADSHADLNPFLSRSQQLAVERSRKKQQVRDMVVRLPFVEQAWFEMDRSESGGPFNPAKQSAVVSIRTTPHTPLSDRHVQTVKQLISGAIADLQASDIVVINLEDGLAHQNVVDACTEQQLALQRITFNQQRFYENRIREALLDYPNIGVHVAVNLCQCTPADQVAAKSNPLSLPPSMPVAGANSSVSIPTNPQPASPMMQVGISGKATNVGTDPEEMTRQISVSLDVPQALVFARLGSPQLDPDARPAEQERDFLRETQSKFERFRAELDQRIRPLMPDPDSQGGVLSINLVRAPKQTVAKRDVYEMAKSFLAKNWASFSVLVIGLGLLTIVTRSKPARSTPNGIRENQDHDVLAINSNHDASSSDATERKLTQLIENDPDSAAKIIESWIRDAA